MGRGKLGLTRDEGHAIREAGLRQADLALMSAGDVVAATEELIAFERAEEIVGLAAIVACGINPSFARGLMSHGVRDRADLASRSPDDMFVQLLDTTSRTHPNFHDAFSQAIYLAGTDTPEPRRRRLGWWTRAREERGFDPILMYWRRRYGERMDLPTPTGRRLRMPTIKVSAPVLETGTDPVGNLVIPVGQKDVVAHRDGRLRLLVGHWMWRGGLGAFAHLERLRPGDGVRVGDEWFVVTDVDKVAAEPSGGDVGAGEDGVVLTTPAHRRVGIIGTEDMLTGVDKGVLRVVVRARPGDGDEADTMPRAVPPIRGAF